MTLWSNTDANTSAPKNFLQMNRGVAANGQTLYANTTAGAFIPNQTVGVFGVSASEMQGTGNVTTISVVSAGDSGTGIPTVTVTGANTVQATATANVLIASAQIYAPGTGYSNGNVMTVTGGTGTSANLTVSNVDANGNILAVTISTAGNYSVIPTLNANPFTSNTATVGRGFTANLRLGIASVTVGTTGEQYNQSSVVVTASANNIANSVLSAALAGNEGGTKVAHAGWVMRKVGTGGRAGRVQYETLVAMGSITGDGPDDSQLAP